MDYQPMGQTPNPITSQTPESAADTAAGQSQSNGVWYVVGAVVIIALGFWYFYGRAPATMESTGTQASVVEETQIPTLSSGDTTADISADLSQIPDTSAMLDADASAAASAISGL